MAPRWLITGATGLLADYLKEACSRSGKVTTTARSGGDLPCDLCQKDTVRRLVDDAAPDIVVHAAALTDVDRCQREPEQAFAANRDTVANLAAVLPASSRIVLISTDQVYPEAAAPHREEAAAPVNVYGQSKLEGEQAALEHPGSVALRTNFFGPSRTSGRESLSDFFVAKFTNREPVRLFDDLLFSPLHMASLGALVVEVAERGLAGVFNAGCREGRSKAAFALAVAKHLNLTTETAEIAASEVLPDRAPRARDLRLDVSRIEAALGRRMPTLDEEIARL